MAKIEKGKDIFYRISHLIEQARKKVAATINQEMVILYWNIGDMPKTNEATSTDLKVIERLRQLGWKRGEE